MIGDIDDVFPICTKNQGEMTGMRERERERERSHIKYIQHKITHDHRLTCE